MKTLSFNEDYHYYELKLDNGNIEILPSVTQIASAVTGKDLSAIPHDVLQEATDRGNAIHKDVSTGEFKTPEGRWIKGLITSHSYVTERKAWCEIDGMLIAGTADIVYKCGIDDIKTQSEEDILYWTIQLNLYAEMYDGIETLRVLHTPKSGNYRIVPIKRLTNEQMVEIVRAYRDGRVLPADWPMEERDEMPTLDLVIHERTLGKLVTNAKAILETVRKKLATYKAENYSEENIDEAKRDKAELNTAAKKLNDARLELEREWMKPFNEFKDVIGTACNEIKNASAIIDNVVKDVENRAKDEKKKLITQKWDERSCKLFPLDKIWSPQWLNKTFKIKDVEKLFDDKIQKVNQDLEVIGRMNETPEDIVALKAYYLDTLSLESAMEEADRMKANRKRILEAQAPNEEPRPTPQPATSQKPVSIPATPQAPEEYHRVFEVWCTREKLESLAAFMRNEGVRFKKVETEA